MADMTGDPVEEFAARLELALQALRDDVAAQHSIPTAPARHDHNPRLCGEFGALLTSTHRTDGMGGAAVAAPRSMLRLAVTGVTGVLSGLALVVVLAVSVGPRLLPYKTYSVRSGSMAPAVPTGSLVVLTRADADDLGPGDIITFVTPNAERVRVTHRIVDVDTTEAGRVFVTKGDANDHVDPWRVPARGEGWRYSFDVPIVGHVFGRLGGSEVRIAMLVVPVAVLGLLAVRDSRRRATPRRPADGSARRASRSR